MGKGGLVTERSQRPALRGFNAHRVDLDCTKTVVDDLGIGRGGNGAVSANGNRKDGRYGHGHLSGRGIAADAAVSGAGQGDGGSACAARCVNRVGSGCRNCERSDHADREDEGYDFLSVLHCNDSFD